MHPMLRCAFRPDARPRLPKRECLHTYRLSPRNDVDASRRKDRIDLRRSSLPSLVTTLPRAKARTILNPMPTKLVHRISPVAIPINGRHQPARQHGQWTHRVVPKTSASCSASVKGSTSRLPPTPTSSAVLLVTIEVAPRSIADVAPAAAEAPIGLAVGSARPRRSVPGRSRRRMPTLLYTTAFFDVGGEPWVRERRRA